MNRPGLPRRRFLQGAASLLAARPSGSTSLPRPTDIQIVDLQWRYQEVAYRTPYKFGGVPVDRATLLHTLITVRGRDGRKATGMGSMPLGNVWAFPSQTLAPAATLQLMRRLADRLAELLRHFQDFGHPIELYHRLLPSFLDQARAVSPLLPKLATLVCASPFDAALHDAYGHLHSRSCYQTYNLPWLNRPLGGYLDSPQGWQGWQEWKRVGAERPRRWLWVFHSVGGMDVVKAESGGPRIGDGGPEDLREWIERDGLTHLKIKLQGEDLQWDIERVVEVDRVAWETRPRAEWRYCVDFNERCPDVEYVLEFLRKVRERSPRGFERILYLEQPTARDLTANRGNKMQAAAKLRPIVVDESLVDVESLELAREMGYTGVALKACKGQSHTILMAAAARRYGMFLTVQDLTCPGASLIHSVGIAAHVPGVVGIEANARQYMPAASEGWVDQYPGIFRVRGGKITTDQLRGYGLSTRSANAPARLW
ncbi:MAG: enolase C-terminal domain-like protein [Blastocatellia bacterium]